VSTKFYHGMKSNELAGGIASVNKIPENCKTCVYFPMQNNSAYHYIFA